MRRSGIQSGPVMEPLLPWIVALVVLLVTLIGTVAWRLARDRKPQVKPLPTEWSLAPRPVFSTDERRVYRQLREALPHHIVLSKLPLVRFCQPNDPQDVRFWYELLGSIHVTFAICSANGRVLAAIAKTSSHKQLSIPPDELKQTRFLFKTHRLTTCVPLDHECVAAVLGDANSYRAHFERLEDATHADEAQFHQQKLRWFPLRRWSICDD